MLTYWLEKSILAIQKLYNNLTIIFILVFLITVKLFYIYANISKNIYYPPKL